MSTIKIQNDLLVEAFFEDAMLLGIQCPLDSHKFAWMINRQMGLDFRYQPEGEIQLMKKGRRFSFPIFKYFEKKLNIEYILYSNLCDGEYLLPELKYFDFLWLIKMEGVQPNLVDLLLAELKQLDAVQMVTLLANDKIKNKEHLIL